MDLSRLPAEQVRALAAVPAWAGIPLASLGWTRVGGITNDTFRCTHAGRSWAVRLPSPAGRAFLDHDAEAANLRLLERLEVVPPTESLDPATGIKVAPWLCGARPLEPRQLREPDLLYQLCALLRRVHQSGIELRAAFRPLHVVEDLSAGLRRRGARVPPEITASSADFARCRDRLVALGAEQAPCHQDLYRGNLLRSGDRLLLIDWEHSGMGDPLYDLADVAVQGELTPGEQRALLETYLGSPPDAGSRERFALARRLSAMVWGCWALAKACLGPCPQTYVDAGRRKLLEARRED